MTLPVTFPRHRLNPYRTLDKIHWPQIWWSNFGPSNASDTIHCCSRNLNLCATLLLTIERRKQAEHPDLRELAGR